LRRTPSGELGILSVGGGRGGGARLSTTNVFAPVTNIEVNVSGGGDGGEDGGGGNQEMGEDVAKAIGVQIDRMLDSRMAQFVNRESKVGGMFKPNLVV